MKLSLPHFTANTFRIFHFYSIIIWLCLALPGLTIWRNSLTFVIAMSLWANIAAHFAAWQSSRIECKQEKADEDNPSVD